MCFKKHAVLVVYFSNSTHFHTPLSWGPGLVLVIDHCIYCLQNCLSDLRLFVALFMDFSALYYIVIPMPWLPALGLFVFLTLWFPTACVTELPKYSIVGVGHWYTFQCTNLGTYLLIGWGGSYLIAYHAFLYRAYNTGTALPPSKCSKIDRFINKIKY